MRFQMLILTGLLAASALAVVGAVLVPFLQTPEPPKEMPSSDSAPPNPFDTDPWTEQEPRSSTDEPPAVASASLVDLPEPRQAPRPEPAEEEGPDDLPPVAAPVADGPEPEPVPGGPVRIEAVTAEQTPDGLETVVLRGSGPITPEVYPLEGKNPFGSDLRLVLDVKDVESVAESVSGTVLDGGRVLKRVRTSFTPKSGLFRAVLDLDPDTPFQMEQKASAGGEQFVLHLKNGRHESSEDGERLAGHQRGRGDASEDGERLAANQKGRDEAPTGGVLVRAVTLQPGEEAKGDRLLIQADRFFEPVVFGLEGANPYGKDNRLVVDIPEAAPPPSRLAASAKSGRLIRAVRTHYHDKTGKLRVVLDLAPASSYEASQAFFSKQNIYCLSLTGPTGQAKSPPPPEKEPPAEKADPPLPEAPDLPEDPPVEKADAPPPEAPVVRASHPAAETGSGDSPPLRSNPANLSEDNLRAMFQKHGFYSTCGIYNAQYCNQGGDFANRLQACGPGVVCDSATGLMWERAGSPGPMPWHQALAWIRDRNRREVGGHRDWRLPTLEELLSLMERSWGGGGLYIDDLFDTAARSCWSGDLRGDERAWKVNFHLGYAVDASMEEGNWVRAVRTLAPGALRADTPPFEAPEESPLVAQQRE